MEHQSVWIAYLAAALLCLLSKFVRYIYNSKKYNKNWKQSLVEWFFEPSSDNVVSWVATIGFVWVLGYLYVERILNFTGIIGSVVNNIPVSCPVAFLLGYLAESIAPAAAKWLITKVKGYLTPQ